MLSMRGRSSPSFLIAVAVLVVGVGGYGLWAYFRPSPHARSEMVVRDFGRAMGRAVRDYRREVRSIRPDPDGGADALNAAVARIDQATRGHVAKVEKRADDAHDELAELDIALRTQKNRTKRIRARSEEAKEMIAGLAEERKAMLRDDE